MQLNWITAIFVGLSASSSRLRQTLWHRVYNHLANKDTAGNFIFMNYGYQDENDTLLSLDKQDEPFRYYIQLYNHVVKDIDLHDKKLLEIGCGRGGGGAFLLRYKHPKSYTGIDLSETAIARCKQQFKFNNAKWLQGLADALPVADNSIDVAVNVESSHCYPSMPGFLAEVNRILKPDGYMAFCDLRPAADIEKLDADIHASGFNVIKHNVITSQVINALDHVSETRDAQIATLFPFIFRKAMRDYAAIKDTAVYTMLKSGKMQYVCYLLQKNE